MTCLCFTLSAVSAGRLRSRSWNHPQAHSVVCWAIDTGYQLRPELGLLLELLFVASPHGLDLLVAHSVVIGHQGCMFPEREKQVASIPFLMTYLFMSHSITSTISIRAVTSQPSIDLRPT